jgi:hypothetical protein
MARSFRFLIRVAVFVVVFIAAGTPSWLLLENLFTRDFSSTRYLEIHQFVVLVRRADRGDQFSVDYYPGIRPESNLVTEFSNADIATINSDLRASVGDYRSRYQYFKVLSRGAGFVDVSLEEPPKGDFWKKNSYRIQSGGIRPRRQMLFTPFFGVVVVALASVAGIVAVMVFEYALRRRAAMVARQPPSR